MDISEMHVWFRQYAQQMGMQNVRAILPEQIDMLINTSITDIINDVIRKNIGITSDRVITNNSKLGQINALKSLYKVEDIPFTKRTYSDKVNIYKKFDFNVLIYPLIVLTIITEDTTYTNSFSSSQDSINTAIETWLSSLNYTSISVSITQLSEGSEIDVRFSSSEKDIYNFIIEGVVSSYSGQTRTTLIDKVFYENSFDFENRNFYNGLITYKNLKDYLYLVDFSIDYSTTDVGFNEENSPIYNDAFQTNLFPIRLIDDANLADTLNDFILKPRFRSPIMVIYNNQMDIYLGKLINNNGFYTGENGLVPRRVRVSYINKPAKVRYIEDLNSDNVNCDLPEYMHVDILKHAVDLYNIAISGSLKAAQQQAQNQVRENIRNNIRE